MEQILVNLVHGYVSGLLNGGSDRNVAIYSDTIEEMPKKIYDAVFGNMNYKWYMTKRQFLSQYQIYVNKIDWIEFKGEILPIHDSSTYEKESTEWLLKEVQCLLIENGIPIIDSVIELLPGMKIYTSSGLLGFEGRVLSNDGKYVTAIFNNDTTIILNKNGNPVGGGKFSNKSFSVYDFNS